MLVLKENDQVNPNQKGVYAYAFVDAAAVCKVFVSYEMVSWYEVLNDFDFMSDILIFDKHVMQNILWWCVVIETKSNNV